MKKTSLFGLASDSKDANKKREIEKTDYDTTFKDYSESIDALERAIDVSKKQAYDPKQAGSILQVSALTRASFIPQEIKRTIEAFLEEPGEGFALRAPEVPDCEFQSLSVVEMLDFCSFQNAPLS